MFNIKQVSFTSWVLTGVAAVFLCAETAQADPVRGWISQSYKADRKALNQSEDWREDRLREREHAVRDSERAAWLNARKNVPPQVRGQLDREYHARRKAINRSFDNQRDGLRAEYDYARDAITNDYRQSLRSYNVDRRTNTYYAPTRLEPWPPVTGRIVSPPYGIT